LEGHGDDPRGFISERGSAGDVQGACRVLQQPAKASSRRVLFMPWIGLLKGVHMRKSKFTLMYPLDGNARQYLVYNTFHRTAAVVSSAAWECLHSDNLLNRLPVEQQETLAELGMLAPEDDEEWHDLRNALTKGNKSDCFFPVLAYTARCNMDCVYCFQEGMDRDARMTPDIAAATIDWMRAYMQRNGPFTRLCVSLFGGEPLADMELTNYFVTKCEKLAAECSASLVFNLTTNGLLMDRHIAEDLFSRGLRAVQVTLDGPARIHDARRMRNGGQGTFQTILENLVSIAGIDGLAISLEANLDEQNIKYFGELLDVLASHGLQDRLSLVPEPTLETMACLGQRDHHCNRYLLKGYRLIEAFRLILREAYARGFHLPEVIGVSYPCSFVERHHYIVDFYGRLYRCSLAIGNPEFVVGNVVDGFNWRNEDMLASSQVMNSCVEKGCAYLPICGGGCRYEAWVKTGNYLGENCKKPIIDALLPLSLMQHFALRH
jgi:uncharacterized protein